MNSLLKIKRNFNSFFVKQNRPDEPGNIKNDSKKMFAQKQLLSKKCFQVMQIIKIKTTTRVAVNKNTNFNNLLLG